MNSREIEQPYKHKVFVKNSIHKKFLA